MRVNDYDREAVEDMLFAFVSAYESDSDLETLTILNAEKLSYGGWFYNCRLIYTDGMMMEVPFVHYEGEDWIFTPCDWQGKLPAFASDIDKIDWRVDDTDTEGIIFEGQPMLAPWADGIKENTIHLIRKDVGKRIADARKNQGLNVRDLAEKCGLSKNHISRIETGKYNYTIDTLICVTRALGLHLTITENDISEVPYFSSEEEFAEFLRKQRGEK